MTPLHRLVLLSVLPHTHQSEMKYSLHIFGTSFVHQHAIFPPMDKTMWFPREQMLCSIYLTGLQIHLGGIMSAPDCSSRLESEVMCTHILAGPELPRCLQESFCSSLCCIFTLPKQGKRGIKKGKTAFQQADQLILLVPAPRLPWLLYGIKSHFKSWSLNIMSTLCIGSILAGKVIWITQPLQ
jgi:hypothetical protein